MSRCTEGNSGALGSASQDLLGIGSGGLTDEGGAGQVFLPCCLFDQLKLAGQITSANRFAMI